MANAEATRPSRREAEILEILYRRRKATVAEVQSDLADPPSYSAVRKLLEILERRGYTRHTVEGRRYIYTPAESMAKARKSALRRMLNTFFDGSTDHAVVALLGMSGRRPDEKRLKEILALANKLEREEK